MNIFEKTYKYEYYGSNSNSINDTNDDWNSFVNVFRDLLLDKEWRVENEINPDLLDEIKIGEFFRYNIDNTSYYDTEFWKCYKYYSKILNKYNSKKYKILNLVKDEYFKINKDYKRNCCFILSDIYEGSIKEYESKDDIYSGLLSNKIRELSIKLGWILKLKYNKTKQILIYTYIKNKIKSGNPYNLKIFEEHYKYIRGTDTVLECIEYWEPEDRNEYNIWLKELNIEMKKCFEFYIDERGITIQKQFINEYRRLRDIKYFLTNGYMSPKWYSWNCGEDYDFDNIEKEKKIYDDYYGIRIPIWNVDNYYTADYGEVYKEYNNLPKQKLFNKFFTENDDDKKNINTIFYKDLVKMRVHYFIDMDVNWVTVYRINTNAIKKKFTFQLILKSKSCYFRYNINKVIEYVRLIDRRMVKREEKSMVNRKV